MTLEDVLSCNQRLESVWGQSQRRKRTFLLHRPTLEKFTELCKKHNIIMTQVLDKAMTEVIAHLETLDSISHSDSDKSKPHP